MAKLYKAIVYILDVNECYSGIDDIICEAERGADDANFNCFNVQEVDVEWRDDIDINRYTATQEDYERYFENH